MKNERHCFKNILQKIENLQASNDNLVSERVEKIELLKTRNNEITNLKKVYYFFVKNIKNKNNLLCCRLSSAV